MAAGVNLKPAAPHAAVFVLLLATSAWLARMPPPLLDDTLAVRLPLPERVDGRDGVDLLFCQEEKCQQVVRVEKGEQPGACPACGGGLSKLALQERAILPADVRVERKQYAGADGGIAVTVVVNGRERGGIHRPEMCLAGQGYRIVGSSVRTLTLPDSTPLSVAFLDVKLPLADGAEPGSRDFLFAYWFAAPGRQTASHWARQFWMAADLVLHGTARRWSYTSLMMECRSDQPVEVDALARFIARLHPALRSR